MDQGTGFSVLLRNLRYSTTPEQVRERFETFGKVRDVYLPLDFTTRRPRGFGFVEYYEKADALEAIKMMDNTEFDGSVISCFFAQDRRKSPDSMRRVYHGPPMRSHKRDYYEPRYRSRSRSFGRRRSPSYMRRYPDRRGYYSSPPRYNRDYRPPMRYDRGYRHPPRYDRDYRHAPRDGGGSGGYRRREYQHRSLPREPSMRRSPSREPEMQQPHDVEEVSQNPERLSVDQQEPPARPRRSTRRN
ncbi:bifunctional RNA-binding domain superfamily/RNA recognition motif domain/Nucleotide-binding alpha-beta plait domain superfamily [Babesia duncani]|uniref:Bifunctional RNA-binding domain superfamily/RNA recognition motif domain/Nucleotide-binding alpha-beta plait domain superfamily n=1 Tax=Babesia duncani TaxID=323732 RepID=A0AAD9PNX6_9APIC|nr:bifunctional RNA-binding domain superfamily/RNA recognition motif domain/Nucleotide-binding alpha-beta plait domain superfamily [Babesia duncani]